MMILPPDPASMIRPNITISPFTHQTLNRRSAGGKTDRTERVRQGLLDHLGRGFMLTNSGRSALDLVMTEIGTATSDVVTIFTSLGNNYVSGCVTRTVEKHCRWSMRIEPETKVLLVIHEWGIPHPGMDEICAMGLPVIEDCAYSFASRDNGSNLGMRGKYSIYSLPKFFSVNFGGIVCGLAGSTSVLHRDYEDYLCRHIENELSHIDVIINKRKSNWNYLKKLFGSVGAQPFFELDQGTVPGVFMFNADSSLNLDSVKAAYGEHGIESSVFYGTGGYYIPCNQRLSRGAMEYMFAVYAKIFRESLRA